MKMKAFWCVLALTATVASAADSTITNYFSGYVCVPSTFTNAGDTGLSPSNAYVCVPVATLPPLTEAQAAATTNGDVRVLFYAITEQLFQGFTASTNAPANLTIDKVLAIQQSGTNTDAIVQHNVTTRLRVGTSSIPAE
jgi:hypothetical protein